jgi:predicted neuraminidase
MTMPRFLGLVFFALALVAAAWRAPVPAAPRFVPPPPAAPSALPSEFTREQLPVVAFYSHSATLAELPDGRIAAAWYAGTWEAARDGAIWFSIRDAAGWSAARSIATPASTIASTGAYVSKLGNAVLDNDDGRLHLWYVSAAVGGWAVSSVNHAVSDDSGTTWSPAEKLVTSPFLNLSTLVRTPPVKLVDGGLGLPVYHEFVDRHGEFLRLSPQGRILGKARMPGQYPALQPSVAVLDETRALALLRGTGTKELSGSVLTDRSDDGGVSWQGGAPLPMPNPDSSVAVLRLASGTLLLVANPVNFRSRHLLQLFLSEDEGRTWTPSHVVENDLEHKVDFSYPALLQTRDGRIHLAYTYKYQAIAHVTFTEAWLKGAP